MIWFELSIGLACGLGSAVCAKIFVMLAKSARNQLSAFSDQFSVKKLLSCAVTLRSKSSQGGRVLRCKYNKGFFCRGFFSLCGHRLQNDSSMTKFMRAVSAFLIFSVFFSTFVPTVHAASQGDLYFIHQDHLGSTTVITDEAGEVVSQERNYPYGADRINADGQRIYTERDFTGQIQDRSTALHYYNARYYDPALGTFVSADIEGERFFYAGGNPIINTDPTGHYYGDYGYSNPGTVSGGDYRNPRYNSSAKEESYPIWGDPDTQPSWGELWEEMNRPWYLRETKQGKVMGDLFDMGKGLAAGVALYGAGAGISKIYRDWDPVGDIRLGDVLSSSQWGSLSSGSEAVGRTLAVQDVGQYVSASYSYTSLPWEKFQGPLGEFRSAAGPSPSIEQLESFHDKYGFDCKLFSDMARAQLAEEGVESSSVSLFPSEDVFFGAGAVPQSQRGHRIVSVRGVGFLEPQTGAIFPEGGNALEKFYANRYGWDPSSIVTWIAE